ncbi:hypothetical protein DPMN_097542 [Dreissena polymorpha]|uniref:Uncharacterized protein n=1 Tax=Dreissena polymorpha TaxID=45954 RepID=A0A9D4LD36_DREPO|nr:hypothetical protein DPMN_097542 [Dreissena polymorpha]
MGWRINILTKFHKDWMKTVTSIVYTRFINILTKFHKDWIKTVTSIVYTKDLINILTKFHKAWMKTVTSIVYTSDLIYILTKFHKDWMKTVTSTVYTNKLLTDGRTHNGHHTAQNIIGTNLLTKFHEDWKINVASREKCPAPPGSHVFQPTGIIFELVQDIIRMNLLTKFHENRTVNVASRVFTRFYYSHIRKIAPPLGSHVFQANIIIFKLIQDIIETNLLTKFQ